MIAAIVLAAGESTRMGAPKALLPDGEGRVFVTRVLHTFAAAGLRSITVVTGSLHERIVDAVARDAPRGVAIGFAKNPDPARGQLSSLLAGLNAVDRAGVRALLMTLVDVPFVAASTVRAVIDAHDETRALIVRPARGDRHGHPVLFARSVFDELRRADPARGAKAVVHAHAADVLDLETGDEGAFIDLDTREEYDRMLKAGAWDRCS